MTAEEILDKFQKEVIRIHKEASLALKSLDDRHGDRYRHITSMYECEADYYINVARYAWAERAKQIAMIEMQSLINEIKSELNKPVEETNHYKELYHDLTDWMIDNKLTSDNVVWKKIVELEKNYNETTTPK